VAAIVLASSRAGAAIAFILTLPITVVTLGLFLLVLNAGMVGAGGVAGARHAGRGL